MCFPVQALEEIPPDNPQFGTGDSVPSGRVHGLLHVPFAADDQEINHVSRHACGTVDLPGDLRLYSWGDWRTGSHAREERSKAEFAVDRRIEGGGARFGANGLRIAESVVDWALAFASWVAAGNEEQRLHTLARSEHIVSERRMCSLIKPHFLYRTNAVTRLCVERNAMTFFTLTGCCGDYFTLMRLFLGQIRDDDSPFSGFPPFPICVQACDREEE